VLCVDEKMEIMSQTGSGGHRHAYHPVQAPPPAPGFLGLLKEIEKSVPEGLYVHLIADNYCTHKHAKVRTLLAQHPRFYGHFTSTYAS
jgi:hypothetical protein